VVSTFSTRLRIENLGDGEQSGTWGRTTDDNLVLLEEAISGVATITHTDATDYTLTSFNAVTDEARKKILNVSGTLTTGRNIVIPSVEKSYIVRNNTSGGFDLTIKTSGGTGVAVKNGKVGEVFCDGTDCFAVVDGDEAKVDDAETITGNWTVSGTLTITSAFTTNGIDDNASAKRLGIEDASLQLGPNDTSVYPIVRVTSTTGALGVFGSNAVDLGGGFVGYGSTHATKPSYIEFKEDSTVILEWNTTSFDFQSNAITNVGALTCGALTSTGIDDNATSERLQISDSEITVGAINTDLYDLVRGDTAGGLTVSGGSTGALGATVSMYGESHATKALDFDIKSSASLVYLWDDSGNIHTWYASSGVARMTLDADELVVSGHIEASSGHQFKANDQGSAIAPVFSVDADGAGNGTGVYGENTGTTDFLSFCVDGVDFARFADITGSVGLQMRKDLIYRNLDTAFLEISGGNATDTGSNIKLYGSTHGSQANDVEFRTGSIINMSWDNSAGLWDFEGNALSGIDTLIRGSTTSNLDLSGGSTTSLGGGLTLYGESHASKANDVEFISGSTIRAAWDHSATRWDFQNGEVANVGTLRFNDNTTQTTAAGETWTEYDLGTYAISTKTTQAHGLGARPEDVQLWLENTTTEYNYTVGQRVLMSNLGDAGNAARSNHIIVDTTNVVIIAGSVLPNILDFNTPFTVRTITAANWKWILRVRD